MKIQCDVCERAEASVLCCADEAALCWACDEKVHAANKLAGKHQRLPLYSPSSQTPKCDICQEKAGYFFCLEDRALLCRQCDVSIHTASPFVSSHQRFLVTGVQVALQQHSLNTAVSSNPSSSSTSNAASSAQPANNKRRASITPPAYSAQQMVGYRPHWPLDEMLVTSGEFDAGRMLA
ncbi:B-box zinc finger protein 22-like isoform X2 [Magnolia sinica]|uniref:B-box zinc finger protein 22-like isoform X2 n=1 Tax=Magnolia sinica TaxID=86752 RepID=UPI0026580775|nr:B-box zinc finger protein 22-like isoform X2 [Magnolia sinica]